MAYSKRKVESFELLEDLLKDDKNRHWLRQDHDGKFRLFNWECASSRRGIVILQEHAQRLYDSGKLKCTQRTKRGKTFHHIERAPKVLNPKLPPIACLACGKPITDRRIHNQRYHKTTECRRVLLEKIKASMATCSITKRLARKTELRLCLGPMARQHYFYSSSKSERICPLCRALIAKRGGLDDAYGDPM